MSIKQGETTAESFTSDEKLVPSDTRFYFSPGRLLAEAAKSEGLDGKMIFYDAEMPPSGLPEELIRSLRSGDLECDDVEPYVDLVSTPEACKDGELTIASVFAVCFDETVVRIGDKRKMLAALEAFNSIVSKCESADFLECIDYSGLFETYTQGCNWQALVPERF